MTTRQVLTGVFATGICCGTSTATAAKQHRPNKQNPNVVFIIADDLGYGDLSCYGQEKFSTPNIDRLALSGIRFTSCYSGTTVSAPSRTSLMTGFHSGHTPIRGNKEVQPEGQMSLPEGSQNLFRIFKAAGYTTGCFGKWGLGAPGTEGAPDKQGVDEFFGYNCQLLAHNYYADHLWENDTRVDLTDNANGAYGTYTQDLIQQKGLDFLDKYADEPFFLFLPYVLPHAELIVPEDEIIQSVRGKYPETPYNGCDSGPYFRKGGYCSQKEPHATFAAMVMRLDKYVGEVVDKLKQLGVYDNTLIIFCSDNGPHCEGGADPDFFNSNGVFRGYKRDLYEGGIRVPFIASWPHHITPGENHTLFTFWDMMPTFAALTDSPAQNKCSDGISILPTLTGKGKQQQHPHIYFEFHEGGGRQAVRQGDWKLIRLNVSQPAEQHITELYNLATDPSENHNLAGEFPEKVKELERIINQEHTFDPNWPLLHSEKKEVSK